MGGQTGFGQLTQLGGIAAAPFTGGLSLAAPLAVNMADGAFGTNGKPGSLSNMLGSGVQSAGEGLVGAGALGAGLGASGMEGMSAKAAVPAFMGGTGFGAAPQNVVGPGLSQPAIGAMTPTATGGPGLTMPTTDMSAAAPVNIASPMGATNQVLNMANTQPYGYGNQY